MTSQGKPDKEIEMRLVAHDNRTSNRIAKCEDRIGCLEQAKRLRRNLSLSKELISDNVRRYGQEHLYIDADGRSRGHIIETHCTIFRTRGAHRNTYFGHVSLYSKKFINGFLLNEKVWHYGVLVPDGSIEPVNPRYPLRTFWPANAIYSLLSDLCLHCEDNCEASNGFPAGIYISNVLLEHFNTCISVFNTAQWPDQEWGHPPP